MGELIGVRQQLRPDGLPPALEGRVDAIQR
jgi:hypothetical protein